MLIGVNFVCYPLTLAKRDGGLNPFSR